MVLALKIAAHVGPDEGPTAGNFQFEEVPGFEETLPVGHVHLRLTHVSVDPWYLGLIKPGLYSWCQPTPVGNVMYGTCVSTVSASSDPALAPGDVVSGFLPLQAECRVPSAAGLTKIGAASPEEALSIFGGPALTAFFGLKDVASPKSGVRTRSLRAALSKPCKLLTSSFCRKHRTWSASPPRPAQSAPSSDSSARSAAAV